MDLKIWAPLCLLDQSILDKVRLAYVFGSQGHNAIIVTEDDEVLACGPNEYGYLGSGNECPSLTPTIISELEKEGVKGFSCGYGSSQLFMAAYTSSGKVYFWGSRVVESKRPTVNHNLVPSYKFSNSHASSEIQVSGWKRGRPSSSVNSQPQTIETPPVPTLVSFPSKISEVACGTSHCLALSMDGQVHSWGCNDAGQLGNGTTNYSDVPVTVEGHLKGKLVIKVSCGDNFSVAVLDNGQVFAWGSNNFGQSGLLDELQKCSSVPVPIQGLNDVIIDVVCGSGHVLVVTNYGTIYGWGKNTCGELGLGDYQSRLLPERVRTDEKFIDIAAICKSSISAAMNDKLEVFMWGDFSDFHYSTPQKTAYKSLQEVFAYFGSPRVMYKPVVRELQKPSKSVFIAPDKIFQDRDTSDLTIIAEGKVIYIHRDIVSSRSDYLRTLLQERWVERDEETVELNKKYEVILSYLRYLYTGEIKIDPEFAPDLLYLAEEYQDLTFKHLCEEHLDFDLKIDNVADLFAFALKLKATIFMEKCVNFASYRLTDVLLTPDVSKWENETWQEFMTQCGKRKLLKS